MMTVRTSSASKGILYLQAGHPNEVVVETDQLSKEAEYALKSVRSTLRTFLLAIGLGAISLLGTIDVGSAVMSCMAGIMVGIDAYSFKVSATQLEQLNLPKPAWLDWARIFALVGGSAFG
jgi:hypothetical protein